MDALQLGAETAKKERRAPEQKKVGKCESLHAAVAALQLFKSLLYFSRPGQVQPADISEASCQATMCFPGLRGLCQAFRGDLRWMKEAQAPASPATFFAFPTCTSAGDPLGLELAGESVSSQKNPSFCGILRVVRLGLRVVTANRVNVLGSGSAMRIGRCGTAAGLRGGCGAAVAGAAVGRLRGGCGAAGLPGGCGIRERFRAGWGDTPAERGVHENTKNCGIRARRFRVKWGDTPADLGVHENTKNCGIRARRFRVKWGDTPADLGVHENTKNCGIRARRFRVKWGDTPAERGVHENTKNCGIRARRFRVKWGDTPADLGVHENTKNCGIRARRFRVKWGDTPADLGVHENTKNCGIRARRFRVKWGTLQPIWGCTKTTKSRQN